MRRPRPHDYDPKFARASFEEIDMDGVVPIRSKQPTQQHSTTIYTEHHPEPRTQEPAPTPVSPPPAPQPSTPAIPATQPATQTPTQQASNIAILQLSEEQLSSLREPAYKAQTFRFTNSEIEWLKDTAYQMSKDMKRGKVSQADIIRTALHLFANAKATNQATLLDILQRIK